MSQEGQTGTEASTGPAPMDFGIADLPESMLESEPAPPDAEGASPETSATGVGGETQAPGDSVKPEGLQVTDRTAPAVAQSQPGGFRFMGRDYTDQASAEQAFKSWEGRISAAHSENQKLVKQLQDYYQYVEQAREALNGRAQSAPAQAQTPDKPKKFAESVDWSVVDQIRKTAQAMGADADDMVNRYLAEQTDSYLETRLQDMEERLSAPVVEMQNAQQFNQATSGLFVWARDLADEMGTPLYPELGRGAGGVDESFVRDMHDAWYQLSQQYPQFAFSEAGLDYAYSIALRARAQAGTAAPPSKEAPQETKTKVSDVARDEKGRYIAATKAASTAVNPKSAPTQVVPYEDGEEDDGSGEYLAREIVRRAPRPLQTKGGVALGFTR